jgi:hypothetical protein
LGARGGKDVQKSLVFEIAKPGFIFSYLFFPTLSEMKEDDMVIVLDMGFHRRD